MMAVSLYSGMMQEDCGIIRQARTYYHYACDSLGSVSHVIAGDEFGSEEENVTNRYGFTGEMRDGITGQYYLRARYYVPEIGRFTQADTYHGDGLNLYVYARNNPVKYVDPSGHNSKGNDVPPSSESGRVSVQEVKVHFIVTPRGTVMDTSKDYDLVSTTTPTNQGGEFFQIHNSHSHKGNKPHTHKQQVNTNPVTGVSSSKRVDNFTTAADIDYVDSVLRDGTLRMRINRDDVGGY